MLEIGFSFADFTPEILKIKLDFMCGNAMFSLHIYAKSISKIEALLCDFGMKSSWYLC